MWVIQQCLLLLSYKQEAQKRLEAKRSPLHLRDAGIDKFKAEDWLRGLKLVTEPTAEEYDQLMDLVGHKGFGVLVGLLLAERQGAYVMLSHASLHADRVHEASVLQGKIMGIERAASTLLECAKLEKPTT